MKTILMPPRCKTSSQRRHRATCWKSSSELAFTKADSDKSKQFADRMIKDHTKTSTELKVQVNLPASLDKAHKDKLDKLVKLSGKGFHQGINDLQRAAL